MSRHTKLNILSFFVIGILITFGKYTIVIGQTPKPVLVALNKDDATLAIIDPASMKVLGKAPTGDSPHEVVISADGKTAYVANYGTGPAPGSTLSIIDLATMKETRRADLSPLIRPHGIVMLGGKIYFSAESNRLIARYDPAANKIDWLMGTGQNVSHMVVATADQKKFATANIGSDSVTVFEFANVPPAGSKITHIPVGKQPEAVDISPDGKQVWAGLNQDLGIDVVDVATAKVIERIKLGARPYRVTFAPDGKTVYATLLQTKELVSIDAETRKEIKRLKLESVPLGIAFAKNAKLAFVTVVEPDAVLKVDLEKMEVTGRVETGKVPDGVAVWGI